VWSFNFQYDMWYELMKRTKLDKQARVVIPKTFRDAMNIKEGSPIVMTLIDDEVVLRPDESACVLCGTRIEGGKHIRLCNECLAKVVNNYAYEEKKNKNI